MANNFAHCEKCDMTFSFIDEPDCPKCKTRIQIKSASIARQFKIGDTLYEARYYYETDGQPEDYAGYLLNQALICLMAFHQGHLTIKEIDDT